MELGVGEGFYVFVLHFAEIQYFITGPYLGKLTPLNLGTQP